ncbi:hypothetical protein [Arthrobacter sp. USHLN218]|uniref:hypothetical protein n=1 Tax=Arthrobacter sp. USHLN218 TaxID=3081232 RepID=UPI00301881DC
MDPRWQHTVREWATAWAAVRGLESETDGAAVVTFPDEDHIRREYLAAWPGADAARIAVLAAQTPDSALILATADPDGTRAFASEHGLSPAASAVLLTATTDSMDQEPALPADGNLSSAALDLYDVVEISVFDRPVATGRLRVEDSAAVIGGITAPGPGPAGELEAAVLAALAGEAAIQGIGTLYTIAGREQASRYTATGWTKTADLITFQSL